MARRSSYWCFGSSPHRWGYRSSRKRCIMTDFSNLLRSTLRGLEDSYKQALNDLKSVVNEVSEAVKVVSPEASVNLADAGSSGAGQHYGLEIQVGKRSDFVATYVLSPEGYP